MGGGACAEGASLGEHVGVGCAAAVGAGLDEDHVVVGGVVVAPERMRVNGALVDADQPAAFIAEIADDGAVVVSFARDLAEATVVDLLFEGGAVAGVVLESDAVDSAEGIGGELGDGQDVAKPRIVPIVAVHGVPDTGFN